MNTDKMTCLLVSIYIFVGIATVVSSQSTIRCRWCNRASTLSDCNKLIICDATLEECFMDELLTDQLTVVYQGGCRSKDVCAKSGKKRSDLVTCSRCCGFGDDCNKRLCGIKDGTLTSSQCYSCDNRNSHGFGVTDPKLCVTLETCQPNEVCYTSQEDFGGKDTFYYGCFNKAICDNLMNNAYQDFRLCVSNKTGLSPGFDRDAICGNIGRRATSICHSCCADGGCNYGTCHEQNARIFTLAENGKFDMTTLKSI
ncbi:uncharacterized protein LOC132717905 [Ruditapes philippinarum]|uniref:uncharacterized protein LOC132717905 n=1 Tax=Ruditapes philippinarum TaxID=129788 RepID=UPI00295B3C10|nr:uncharacterized protein LOC132717905 [Ruditapes philippinarum]